MAWTGYNDGEARGFAPDGLPMDGPIAATGAAREGTLMTTGTLFLEAETPAHAPVDLLILGTDLPEPSKLSLRLAPEGRATLRFLQAEAGFALTTDFDPGLPGDRLRLVLRWSAAFRACWLAVEAPGRAMFAVARRSGALPLPSALLAQLFTAPLAPELRFAALSDRAEPFGLAPALAEGTPVRTSQGWRPVEDLRPGDLLVTADGGPRPLRDIARRDLPTAASFAPVRLEVDGAEPILVTPATRTMVRHAPADATEYMAQAAEIGTRARTTQRFVRYFELSLDRAHLVDAGGHWVEARAPMPGPVVRPRYLRAGLGERIAGAA